MEKRIVEIINKKTKETLKVTWRDSLMYFEGHAYFEELKEKYKEGSNDKKSKL